MTNLKSRLKKLENIKNQKDAVLVVINDLELQSRRYQGLPHEPYVTNVNGIKMICCLAGQDIEHLR